MRVLVFSFRSLAAPFSALVDLITSAPEFGARAVEVQIKEAQCEGIDSFIPKILAEHLPDLAILCWPGDNKIFQEAFSKIKSKVVHNMPVIIAFDEPRPTAICDVLHQGANDFLTSPFRPVDVLPRLWQLVQTLDTPRPVASAPQRAMRVVNCSVTGPRSSRSAASRRTQFVFPGRLCSGLSKSACRYAGTEQNISRMNCYERGLRTWSSARARGFAGCLPVSCLSIEM